MGKFKIGDKVKWSSRTRDGGSVTKHGTVIMTRDVAIESLGEAWGNNPQAAVTNIPGPVHIMFNGSTWGHLKAPVTDGALVLIKPTARAWGRVYKPHFPYLELDQ